MRFEQLRQRVQRAESRVSSSRDLAQSSRLALFDAWRRGWTPGRIVIAGLLSGLLVGRGQPLSRMDGTRWLQLASTMSSMLAALRSAAEDAAVQADAAGAQNAAAAPAADTAAAAATAPETTTHAWQAPQPAVRAPAPAEAATELSER